MYILLNCSSAGLESLLTILKNILKIVQIAGPILLILFLAINITKLAKDPDDKKLPKKIKNQIIATIIIFLVPTIVNAFMLMLDNSFDIASCWNGAGKKFNEATYKKTYTKDLKKILNSRSDYENGDKRKEENDPNNKSSNNNSSNSSSNNYVTATNTGSFTKYNLTEKQLRQLTALAIHEQGTAKGAAAEASLMANRFELYGSKYGSGGTGLINYVKNSGWFANASAHLSDTGIVTSSTLEAVKNVLVGGRRTLPGYIDEHDCFSDISSISTGSVRNRGNYKQFQTKVKNRYGSNYTFYSFPDSNSDPFGYTSESNRKRIGENFYSN